jgi:hypothetical protein
VDLDEAAPSTSPCTVGKPRSSTPDASPGLKISQEGRLAKNQAVAPSKSSPLQPTTSRIEAPIKLKLVLVLPKQTAGKAAPCELSQEWKVVKPRRSPHVNGHATWVAPKLCRGVPSLQSPDYKKVFKGKCFRYLASDHQLVQCREPVHCLNCLGNDRFAMQCKASGRRSIQSLLSFPKPSTHSRLTFPPESINSRISFLELSYAAALASPAAPTMASNYLPGSPSQRPSHSRGGGGCWQSHDH